MPCQSIYNWKHKLLTTQSTTATIPNHGVTRISRASTYVLDAPEVGMLKTIYRSASLTTAQTKITSTSSAGQVAFNSLGGTQVLFLNPTTAAAGEDISVTLLGEATTQWRIINAWPRIAADSTSNGVIVTT